MTPSILVHGYATGLRVSSLRQPFGAHSGFIGLSADVDAGRSVAFRWSKDLSLSLVDSLNLWKYFQLYRDEEALAESVETQSALFAFIDHAGSTTIICHSLGCRLMIGMMNVVGLPSCISKVILLQGDVPTTARLSNHTVTDRLASKTLVIENYHCWWDQSLLASTALHRTPRIGLLGWNEIGIKNIFYPLLKPMNLHTSPLRDRTLLKSFTDASTDT